MTKDYLNCRTIKSDTYLRLNGKWVFLMFLIIFSNLRGNAQDSLSVLAKRFGVSFSSGVMSQKGDYRGFGISSGLFYEKKTMDNVKILIGAGLRFNNFNSYRVGTVRVMREQEQTFNTVDFHEIHHGSFSFFGGIQGRFLYLKKPRLYLLVGLSLEALMQPSHSEYQESTVRINVGGNISTETMIEENPSPYRTGLIGLEGSLGFGIGIGKTDFEFTFRPGQLYTGRRNSFYSLTMRRFLKEW